MRTQVADLVLAARSIGATVLESSAATVIVIAAPTTSERMSADEAASYCKCPKRRLVEDARAGKIPAVEISERAISFAKSDLDEWMRAHPIRLRVVDLDEADERDLAERLEAAQ